MSPDIRIEKGKVNEDGRMEAISGIIQLANRLVRGFRNFNTFRAIATLKASKLKLDLPSLHTHPF